MRASRFPILLVILVAIGVLDAPAAHAVTREQAVASAIGGQDLTGAAVYATPAPLRRGKRVAEAGPGAWSVGKARTVRRGRRVTTITRLRPWRVRSRAWLVWQDQAPGALFVHPGELTLVDDASGRVVARRRTAWWPRVDGRDPPGFGSSARKFAFTAVAGARPARAGPRATGAQDTGDGTLAPLPELPHDCMVIIGDREEPMLAGSFEGLRTLARELNILHWPVKSIADLDKVVPTAERHRCNDVVVAIVAHGYAPAGFAATSGGAESETAQVALTWRQSGWFGTVEHREEQLRSEHIRRLVSRGHARGIKFKIVVLSCYGGRWAVLAGQPGVAVVAASSGPTELSFGPLDAARPVGTRVVNGRLVEPEGLKTPIGGLGDLYGGVLNQIVLGVPDALRAIGPDLAGAIFRAAQNKALSVPARLGLTHPRVVMGVSGKVVRTSRYTTITVENPDASAGEVIGVTFPPQDGGERCSPATAYCGLKCGTFASYCKVELAPGARIDIGATANDRRTTGELDCPGSDLPGKCSYQAGAPRNITVKVRWVPASG